MGLNKCEKFQENNAHYAIEWIQGMSQERGSMWKMKVASEHRKLVQICNGMVDPPDIPDIGKSISNIAKIMGIEAQNQRKCKTAEAEEI